MLYNKDLINSNIEILRFIGDAKDSKIRKDIIKRKNISYIIIGIISLGILFLQNLQYAIIFSIIMAFVINFTFNLVYSEFITRRTKRIIPLFEREHTHLLKEATQESILAAEYDNFNDDELVQYTHGLFVQKKMKNKGNSTTNRRKTDAKKNTSTSRKV